MIRPGSLKIVSPCPGDADIDEEASFCHSCIKAVYDLSSMTQGEAAALLAEHRGRELCVSYRVDGQGEPVFAAEPAPRSLPPIVMAMALAACAPWGLEERTPVDPEQAGECVLVEDGVWECIEDSLGAELEEFQGVEGGEGCAGGEVVLEEVSDVAGGISVEDTPIGPSRPSYDGKTRFEPTGEAVVRIDFEIDPGQSTVRGAMVVVDSQPMSQRLQYTPTRDLVRRWRKKRDEKQKRRLAKRRDD
jgi:hypothetical protein